MKQFQALSGPPSEDDFLFVLLADTTANVCPVLSTSCQSNFLKRFSPRSSSIILGSKNLWDGESRNFMLEAEIDHFSAKQSLSRFHLSRGNGPGLVTTNRMYYTISCSNICLRWGLCGRCVAAQLRLNVEPLVWLSYLICSVLREYSFSWNISSLSSITICLCDHHLDDGIAPDFDGYDYIL